MKTTKGIIAAIVALAIIIIILVICIIGMTANTNSRINEMLERITAVEAVADEANTTAQGAYITYAEAGNIATYLEFADGTGYYIVNQDYDGNVTPLVDDGRVDWED